MLASLFGSPSQNSKLLNMKSLTSRNISRRRFLEASAFGAGSLLLPNSLRGESVSPLIRGKAEHVISIWLGGGMAQIDTFDPKGKGDPKLSKAGSYYDSIETAVPGMRVCEHLSKLAPLMERVTAIRTLHHDVIDEHAAATNRMHTGRPVTGTVTYPSIGSLVSNQ